MNIWQIARQLEFLLKKAVWPSSATKVFDPSSVFTSKDEMSKLIGAGTIPPIGAIRIGAGVTDPEFQEEPGLLRYPVDLELAMTVDGDRAGENALMGANASSSTVTEGRGLLELMEPIGNALKVLTTEDGIAISSRLDGKGEPEEIPGRDNWLSSKLGNDVWTTLDRFYHPPIKIDAVDAVGAGDADITWSLPPSRYDFFNVRLVRKAGSTPPTDENDGTTVFTSATTTSFTDSPGAGVFSYGVFAAYDETDDPPDSQDIFSDGTTTTLTVT